MAEEEAVDTFNPGDRVEYPDVMKFQLGGVRTNHEGVVVDVVRGERGHVELIFSTPDEPFAVLDADETVHMAVVVEGVSPSLRKL